MTRDSSKKEKTCKVLGVSKQNQFYNIRSTSRTQWNSYNLSMQYSNLINAITKNNGELLTSFETYTIRAVCHVISKNVAFWQV